MKRLILILALLMPMSPMGCLYQVDTAQVSVSVTDNVNPEIVSLVRESVKNISPEDRATLIKINLGFSSFLKSAIPSSTFVAIDHLKKVQKIYGWEENKCPQFNDVTESILKNTKYTNGADYSVDQKIGDVKDNLSTIIASFGEGLK